jgi:hypothetical protein
MSIPGVAAAIWRTVMPPIEWVTKWTVSLGAQCAAGGATKRSASSSIGYRVDG